MGAAAVIAAFVSFLPHDRALGQACGLDPLCGLFGQDATRTASILVSHVVPDGTNTTPVQPDDGETWSITSIHQLEDGGPTGCRCDTRNASVTAAVSWTGAGWNVACTGCGGGSPIQDVIACGTLACTAGGGYSAIYELIVDVNANHPFTCGAQSHWGKLKQVDFETTSVDPGDTIRTGNCSLQDPVTPTSQTFSVSDTGPFECGFTCNDATGPSISITYQ